MNDFGGAVSDDMHAKKLERVRIEENFYQALFVAQHLAFREFGVAGQAALVGRFFLR